MLERKIAVVSWSSSQRCYSSLIGFTLSHPQLCQRFLGGRRLKIHTAWPPPTTRNNRSTVDDECWVVGGVPVSYLWKFSHHLTYLSTVRNWYKSLFRDNFHAAWILYRCSRPILCCAETILEVFTCKQMVPPASLVQQLDRRIAVCLAWKIVVWRG